LDQLFHAIAQVVKGQETATQLLVAALLAQGHVLIEDIPGVGKTTLARALARSVDLATARVQFTPDLMASDLVGVSVYRPNSGQFEFSPGPIFANVVVADEINRASPKTQSALLEAMEEGTVTVDGHTYDLPTPFIVLATQNPFEMEGTYALPEAQRDRFMVRLALGYPAFQDEVAMLDASEFADPIDHLQPVLPTTQLRHLITAARVIYAAPAVKTYLVDLVVASRQMPGVRLGISPRGGIQLLRMAKAWALLKGRDHLLPDDVQAMVVPVWGHRLVLARGDDRDEAESILRQLIAQVPVR
jgi:MoxR-like ATPase